MKRSGFSVVKAYKKRRRDIVRSRIAVTLVGMRKGAGLTQCQVAEQARWSRSFISRLEGAGRAVEDPVVLARYAAACGHALGLLFGAVEDGQHRITDTVILTSPVGSRLFDSPRSRAL